MATIVAHNKNNFYNDFINTSTTDGFFESFKFCFYLRDKGERMFTIEHYEMALRNAILYQYMDIVKFLLDEIDTYASNEKWPTISHKLMFQVCKLNNDDIMELMVKNKHFDISFDNNYLLDKAIEYRWYSGALILYGHPLVKIKFLYNKKN